MSIIIPYVQCSIVGSKTIDRNVIKISWIKYANNQLEINYTHTESEIIVVNPEQAKDLVLKIMKCAMPNKNEVLTNFDPLSSVLDDTYWAWLEYQDTDTFIVVNTKKIMKIIMDNKDTTAALNVCMGFTGFTINGPSDFINHMRNILLVRMINRSKLL